MTDISALTTNDIIRLTDAKRRRPNASESELIKDVCLDYIFSDEGLRGRTAVAPQPRETDDLAAAIKANLAQSSAHLHPTQNEVDSGETHKRRAAINDIISGNAASGETPVSFLDAVKSGELPTTPVSGKIPTISIVTIFNKANAAEWLETFLEKLPVLRGESIGEIEVILCETIHDPNAPENGLMPIQSIELVNGMNYKKVQYIHNSDFNYADARNAAKYYAEGEWILSLDTDEYLLKEQLPELVNMVANAPFSAGGISVTVFSHIRDGDKYQRDAQAVTRLFRNDRRIMWQSQIHEVVSFSIQRAGYLILDSTITIFHRGYECKKGGIRAKLERNKMGLMREILTTNDPYIRAHADDYLNRTVLLLDSIK